ncbi:MAG: DNA polymerase III subunit delta [Byssovorax sp.]
MTPEAAIAEAQAGKPRPAYLVLGEERLLVDRVVSALREAAQKGGIAGFNEDKFTAGESSAGAVISAAKSLPMMAKLRFVLLRGLDRWEKKGEEGDEPAEEAKGKKGKIVESPLDDLAEYVKDPVPSTVLVLVAPKLNGQRRLVTAAKKGGFLVSCEPLSRQALPGWIESTAKAKGHAIAPDVADYLAEIAGPDLGYVNDAIERLSLFVGPKQPITEDAVALIVTRVRQSTVWELIDLLGKRKLAPVLATLADVYDPRDGGLKLLGALTWSIRQLVKLQAALRSGGDPREAAARAGIPPFRAQESAQVVRAMPPGTLERWLRLLAHADLSLKSSRRPAQAVLEAMLIEMCGARPS